MSFKSKYKLILSLQITRIGLPTNVTHHTHASNIQDAQKLIQDLMSSGGTGTLPAPLAPTNQQTPLLAPTNQQTPLPAPMLPSDSNGGVIDDQPGKLFKLFMSQGKS